MANALQAVRGMNDVLPDEAPLWEYFEETVRGVFRHYGYRNIRTPIVEKTELFVRGVGQMTDIVEKEMYTFDDNGESLSLRPEGTAPTVRAALEHNLLYDGPKRLWYSGPLFRHERPQKGRYRQYDTFGAEALGFAGPDIDIELLVMVQRLWQRLGLTDITLELNTIGSADERRIFREQLITHFQRTPDLLRQVFQRCLADQQQRIPIGKRHLIVVLAITGLGHARTLQWHLYQAGRFANELADPCARFIAGIGHTQGVAPDGDATQFGVACGQGDIDR